MCFNFLLGSLCRLWHQPDFGQSKLPSLVAYAANASLLKPGDHLLDPVEAAPAIVNLNARIRKLTDEGVNCVHCPRAGPGPVGPRVDPARPYRVRGRARLLRTWPGPARVKGQVSDVGPAWPDPGSTRPGVTHMFVLFKSWSQVL